MACEVRAMAGRGSGEKSRRLFQTMTAEELDVLHSVQAHYSVDKVTRAVEKRVKQTLAAHLT